MAWAKIDDKFPRHPKVLAVSVHARWTYIAGLCYCSEFLTDGTVPKAVATTFHNDPDVAQKSVGELLCFGLWRNNESGYTVHDYLDWNLSKRQVTAARKAKSRAGTMGGKAKARARQMLKQKASTSLAISESESESESDTESDGTDLVPPTAPRSTKRKTRRKRSCPDCAAGFSAFRDAAIDLWRQRYTESAGPHWTGEHFKALKLGFHKLHGKALGRWWAFVSYEDFAGYQGHSPDQWYRHLDKWIPRDEHEKLEAPA